MSSVLPDIRVQPHSPSLQRGIPGSGQELDIDIVSTLDAVRDAWLDLQSDNRNSLHQGYDWCAAWVETHGYPLAIVRGRLGSETAFLLPLEIQRHNMVRTAQFIGTRYTNINTGLFAASLWDGERRIDTDKLASLIAESLTGYADLVSLQNIPLTWRGSRHPLASLPADEHLNHTFQLPLSADFTATINQLNGKRRRKKFRNQVRKIEATGSFEHVIARTPEEKRDLLSQFFVQKAVRFKALGLPNVFHAPQTQAFFHRVLEVSQEGADAPLEMHGLLLHGEYEGKIAALAGLSRKGDHVICQFGSIDENILPEASPGELLFWLLIERACSRGAAMFDFGLGDQDYKRRWCTEETVQHDILLPVSALGRFAAVAHRGVSRGKAAIKGNPHLYALIQRLRAQQDKAPATESDD
ncbi:GNAT family N-acetyltransferase [Rhizobium sp. RU36D]|uniref:GNAT family N-acetyltransferase n=1 Tax=Rhizobium sp. RU36D TaxID=1907415 RepID=UPI0009D84552|nr:GNAT family N-acetyltransferase [Rhizobium sp. RU36D]SMD08635.1 Acetyltransferase involved in cellulose biosynthesis, CelD/BcsL family [Rhizobium sp. RU36D]